MLLRTICIFLIINTLYSFCDGIDISEHNTTNLIMSIKSQLSELKTEMERLKEDEVDKESDIKILLQEQKKDIESHFQSLIREQERQGKLIEELVHKSDIQDFRFKPHNCTEVQASGIYNILLSNINSQPFKVVCDAETRGGGWTIILRRMDGTVDFNRKWTEYKNGFGDLGGEFFLGLDKIHELTTERKQELLVILEDFEGVEKYETYDEFAIGDEDEQYVLHTLGKANGTAGDSFSQHKGMKFSTFDQDNDPIQWSHFVIKYTGGWWYHYGYNTNKLTGQYTGDTANTGIHWKEFRGMEYSLKKAVLMIRPKSEN
ncbi:ficolin-1-like [Drosophila innubila]|uniref:ficolin-1-like n=1 Tax=Drosophila innubila TaxID=198719 RepID=UPI00148C689D|nr:ficolin-1-like [Drosophila innubila]